MPRPGLGERGEEALTVSSCPPRTGRELAPSDQPIALVRLSWRRRARAPQPVCMKNGSRLYGVTTRDFSVWLVGRQDISAAEPQRAPGEVNPTGANPSPSGPAETLRCHPQVDAMPCRRSSTRAADPCRDRPPESCRG